ncbi:hypothetical protein [Pseudonocardia spinosispora]|uniref:hypothetical protein n=1 Tax=Pseudonocardia spinosispora TaxID=103441 RepID=UPI000421C6A7|nr:hypothetical protein [Pseudonocardia spinosispora]
MSVLICDRCGDVAVDGVGCRCGVVPREPVDLRQYRLRRAAVNLARRRSEARSADSEGTDEDRGPTAG